MRMRSGSGIIRVPRMVTQEPGSGLEPQADAAALRHLRLYQHVDTCNVPVLEAERLHRLRNPLEVFAPHRDVDIACQAFRRRLRCFDIEIRRQTAHYPIVQPGRREGLLDAVCEIEELLHAFLKEAVDEYRHVIAHRRSKAPASPSGTSCSRCR
jgi:hypothetical protein